MEACSRLRSHFAAGPRESCPAQGVASRGRALGQRRASRTGRLLTRAGLFDPPPFKPEKLSIQYSDGDSRQQLTFGPGSQPSRRYTLTHNDITGSLMLTVGTDYNHQQISGPYTKLLRDEVTAEWRWGSSGSSPSLHVYCHVSGEERWLAPPVLRNYIFRREMPLVLDCFTHADRELLVAHPQLANASVFVHFQSAVEDLDSVECWGKLGQRSTWQPPPVSIMKRLLFGLAGLPIEQQLPQPATMAPSALSSSSGGVGAGAGMGGHGSEAPAPARPTVATASGAAARAPAWSAPGSFPNGALVPVVAAMAVASDDEGGAISSSSSLDSAMQTASSNGSTGVAYESVSSSAAAAAAAADAAPYLGRQEQAGSSRSAIAADEIADVLAFTPGGVGSSGVQPATVQLVNGRLAKARQPRQYIPTR